VELAKGKTIVVQTRTGQRLTLETRARGAPTGTQLSAQTTLGIFGVALGGVSAEFSAITMVWANDAKDAANAANSAAQNVISAANATIAASQKAQSGAVALGCGINDLAQGIPGTQASPFAPSPPGFTCPP